MPSNHVAVIAAKPKRLLTGYTSSHKLRTMVIQSRGRLCRYRRRRVSVFDVRDIAAAALAAVKDEGHEGNRAVLG
jgi:hypothetical protein